MGENPRYAWFTFLNFNMYLKATKQFYENLRNEVNSNPDPDSCYTEPEVSLIDYPSNMYLKADKQFYENLRKEVNSNPDPTVGHTKQEAQLQEQPSKQTAKPIMTTVKPEEEINKVNIGSSEEAVPQKVPNSEIFNLDFWGLDECYKMFMKIIKDSPKNRGKQMVLNKIMQNSSYFHCNALRHKDFAEELNRLQNKFKFTKADVDHAFGR